MGGRSPSEIPVRGLLRIADRGGCAPKQLATTLVVRAMSNSLRTPLLITMLLAQILGVAFVICVEEDGQLLFELQAEYCCGSDEEGSQGSPSAEDPGVCGDCEDMSLAQRKAENESDQVDRALERAADLPPIEFPLAAPFFDMAPSTPFGRARPSRDADGVAVLVAATVVLTC